MKSKILVLTILLATYLMPVQVNGQQENIMQDSMTFAILSLTYYGYELVGGHVSYHPLCDNYCEWDNIPLRYQYVTYGDFFEENFFYTYNNELLLSATYGWMGGGWSDPYPHPFWPVDSFPADQNNLPVPFPQYVKYYTYDIGIPMEEFLLRADSAWKAASTLDIVREYAQYAHWVGIFKWPYNVQIYPDMDPGTRWVIMLYYGNDFITGLPIDQHKPDMFRVYPVNDKLYVKAEIADSSKNHRLKLYDTFGRMHKNIPLQEGIAGTDISNLSKGVYVATISSPDGIVYSTKLVVQ